MDSVEYRLRVLTLESGSCPFEDWYASIKDKVVRARVRSRLIRMKNGNFGDCKGIGQGVSELRIDLGPGYQIYCARLVQQVVLLAGGDKSMQNRDIENARRLWKEHKDVPERFRRDFRG